MENMGFKHLTSCIIDGGKMYCYDTLLRKWVTLKAEITELEDLPKSVLQIISDKALK
jgi:hypothetical protein